MALQTLLSHIEESHALCPQGTSSWCYLQVQIAQHEKDPLIPVPVPREPYLTESEMERVRETFEIFSSLSLCECLTLGKTQNPNESLHNMLWHNAPKPKRLGQRSVQACAALAVLSFNHGTLSLSTVLAEMGISVSHNTLKHFSERDHFRNLARVRRIKETHKRRRRQIVTQTSLAESSRKRREKGMKYSRGKYGAEVPSDGEESDVCNECFLRDCPNNLSGTHDKWIDCDGCAEWYHCKCVGITASKNKEFFCKSCIP